MIIPEIKKASSIYPIFAELSAGVKIFPAPYKLTDGILLIKDDVFIFSGATKKSSLSKGIKKASIEEVNRKNLLQT